MATALLLKRQQQLATAPSLMTTIAMMVKTALNQRNKTIHTKTMMSLGDEVADGEKM